MFVSPLSHVALVVANAVRPLWSKPTYRVAKNSGIDIVYKSLDRESNPRPLAYGNTTVLGHNKTKVVERPFFKKLG
jgi:hypothetical protein